MYVRIREGLGDAISGNYGTRTTRAASDKYQQDVNPLIHEVNNDLRANQHRRPKGAVVAETTSQLKPWEYTWLGYRPELEKAVKSRDISGINPERFFPEDDFVAAVE